MTKLQWCDLEQWVEYTIDILITDAQKELGDDKL